MFPIEINLWTLISTCLLGIYILQIFVKYRWLPPGPWGLPVIGFVPFLKKNFMEDQLIKLSEKYGDVFSFRLGQNFVVVLSSFDAVKEALVKQGNIFAGRPQNYNIFNCFSEFKSLIVTDGNVWKEQRKFLSNCLRDFGLGNFSIEGKIQEEVEVVLDILRQGKLKTRDVTALFHSMATNVICSMCFGKRFDYSNEKLHHLTNLMDEATRAATNVGLIDLFPICRYLPKSWTGIDKIEAVKKDLTAFVDEIIDDHVKNHSANNPTDVIDMYLDKQNQLGLTETDSNSIYSRSYMRLNLNILFFAGAETTVTTLHWAIKLMTIYPEVQRRVQEEIDRVVGRSRLPSLKDRENLPYVEATILEILRKSSIAPLNIVHSNIDETSLKGYVIPKRSFILTNLYQIHYDPKLWTNPNEFNPERFLNSEGKVVKPEYLIPFSTGNRICLGESLAKMEIFLSFTSILQNFYFRYEGNQPLEEDLQPGFLRKARSFDARIEPR